MSFGVLGINHHLAPVTLRSRLAEIAGRRFHPVFRQEGKESLILLSTCNRIEIYFSSSNLSLTHNYLLEILKRECDLPFDQLLYTFFDKACLQHLVRVTSGLDSALLGETEIQGQVKRAYLEAAGKYELPFGLHFLFQKSLQAGKKIRNRFLQRGAETTLERGVEILLDRLVSQETPLLLVGASETNQRLAIQLKKRGIFRFSLSNRTESRGMAMAKTLSCPYIPWKEWSPFEVAIFATSSLSPLLDPEDTFLRDGKDRLFIDLGVPQNVDPRLRELPHLTLFDIDEVQKAAKRGGENRQRLMIESLISNFALEIHQSFEEKKQRTQLQVASPSF